MATIIFVIFILLVMAISIGLYIKRRNESFEGTVLSKETKEVQRSAKAMMTTEYLVHIQTTTGKNIKWQVNQAKYETIKEGDHVSKPAGTTELNVVPQTPSVQTTTPAPSTTSEVPPDQPTLPNTPTTPIVG